MGAQRYDAFVSYAHENAEWVRALATNLHRHGLDVFFDEWDIVGGVRLAERLQEGLAASRAVVLVVSAAAVHKEWWKEEFAAAMAGVAARQQRLVPVLLDDVPLPPFVASRVYVDFRHVDSPDAYLAAVERLVRTVREAPQADRPAREGGFVVPAGAYRAEGPRFARLRITPDEVVFSTTDREERQPTKGLDAGLRSAVLDLARTRSRGTVILRGSPGATGLHGALLDVGRRLGERFLDGPAGQALASAVAQRSSSLRLAVQVDDPVLADLPWETLVLPGHHEPLVLTPGVELHRAVSVDDPPAPSVPGPLRILAVVASPDSGGGELLDYERELARILAALDPSRRDGAHVQVLNWGSPAAIRAALARERFHVLHVSCHASPGRLVLESDTGAAEKVDADTFVRDVLVPDEPVPLVVLAGCSTALSVTDGEKELSGFARDLLHAGIPAVLAMTAPVTDHYATDLCATLYEALARRSEPVPLPELSTVRRALDEARRRNPEPDPWAEWATPALFQAGPPLPLYTHTVATPARPETRVQLSGMIRKAGDFVGRRAELRAILRDLRGDVPGVVLHGIGGIGKSSLAAEVVGQLGAEAGLVIPISGVTRVDLVLEEIRQRLLALCLREALDDRHPFRQVVTALTDATPPWEARLGLLQQVVLPEVPILLVLDNAEDLLTADGTSWKLSDDQLADFLAAWVKTDGCRLIVTTRYPFPLPGRAHKRLPHHHLGPLSEAETRKLIWRLPALDALDSAQRKRAYTDVGGHPRSLEYLDALLAGGDARFDDVAERIETALEKRGIADADTWLDGVGGDLDRALAETVTLAADDVLLDALIARLDPLARQLLLGAAVYRVPVDDIGLQWQVSDHRETEPDPERDRRMAETISIVTHARQENLEPEEVGITAAMAEQYNRDLEALRRPPLAVPDGYARARDGLLRLGLLAPVSAGPDIEQTYLVHRWTATALGSRADHSTTTAAHRRAAQCWWWRVEVWPQDRAADVAQLVEARHHCHRAGDIPAATLITYGIRDQLYTWGAWSWAESLCLETLEWLPGETYDRAAFLHELGMIAQARGDLAQADERFQKALDINEHIGADRGVCVARHHLGTSAHMRGDYDTAEAHYHAALAIAEKIDDESLLASIYHQLGMTAERRGEYEASEQHYRRSLAIKQKLQDYAKTASDYHHLGNLAHRRGDYDAAEQHYRAALAINEGSGNRPAIAMNHHQLGMTAQGRAVYDEAERYYRSALAISEDLGDRNSIAQICGQLGGLFTVTGRATEGVAFTLVALSLHSTLQSPEIENDRVWLNQQRGILGDTEFRRILAERLDPESVENLINALPDPDDT